MLLFALTVGARASASLGYRHTIAAINFELVLLAAALLLVDIGDKWWPGVGHRAV